MHFKQAEIEKTMKKMFDQIDDLMEERYAGHWRLHPNRLKRGEAANKEADGLFNIGAAFSPGFGTKLGRGYVIDVRVSTLERIPFGLKKKLTREAVSHVRELLPKFFPDRKIEAQKDGAVYKLVGDFSLGEVHVD